MIKIFISLTAFAFLFFINNCFGQDCAVNLEAIKGKYLGECKNGKADGQGKSTGIDTYEGTFKSGLPNGTGKYTWINGNTYVGEWYKGAKEGIGIMMYKLAGEKDSIINGFWKKDKYIGKYEKPYLIIKRTQHVSSVAVTKINTIANRIDFSIETIATGFDRNGGGQQSGKVELTDIVLEEGKYGRKSEDGTYGKKMNYIFEEMEFPFKAIFTMGNDLVELEILEPGKWLIEVKITL